MTPEELDAIKAEVARMVVVIDEPDVWAGAESIPVFKRTKETYDALIAEVERLNAERTALRVEFDALSDHARHLRAGLEAWAAASSALEAK